MPTANAPLQNFRRNEQGTVAMIFALSAIMLSVVIGLAIDGGRAYHASSKIRSAIDAAALAAAKGLRESDLNDAEVQAVAQKYFDENMQGTGTAYINISEFDVIVDRINSSVEINVSGEVPTTFGQLAGVAHFDVPASTLAVFKSKDIELGMSLDMTGSMGGSKMVALKLATHDLIDIMLPDSGTTNRVRIGFAPYAAGVNAGAYANATTNNRSPDGCVYERLGSGQTSLDAPSTGNFLSTKMDHPSANACPSTAQVLALTDDKVILHENVDNFTTGGSTAGHLGHAWAGYLLSPAWSSVFPASAEPAAVGEANTIKAVILMTDGQYNTYAGRWGRAADSGRDARALCATIKSQQTVVYAIGFELTDPEAISILQECASTPMHFFPADDGEELRRVFRAIAAELNSLRLAR